MASLATTLGFKWRGPAIATAVMQATRRAVDQTMAEAVNIAKPLAPFKTGQLRGSIKFIPSQITGLHVKGRWGSFGVHYAVFQEFGTIYIAAHPFLRPAADQAYPKLRQRIRSNLAGF